MKATALLSIALCAAFGAAQNLDDISECGRMCINNMLNKASELGCDSTDKACLCSKQNFAFGLRDCTLQACGAEDLPKIIAVGQAICASEGGSMTASGTASDTATGTPTGTPTGTDGPDSTPSETASSTPTGTHGTDSTQTSGSPSATQTTGIVPGGESSAYTTSAIVSTVTSGTEVIETTVGSTTLYTQVSDSNGTASPTSGLTGTPTSGSVAETTTESPTETEIPPGQTTPAEGAAGRVMTTAAPGVAGALGLIALLAM
ncbi:chitinase 3 [Coccidioides immitis RS]|uniref:Chitinase 3 n=2 Tax=Coccidioides immitis TaxID=5501 RepID=A0A0E1RZE7_COCIM|nr:chitinase 3 [Coccidioides immitis RS]EAS37506.1 chitinase 3 [Coccidioides immitis RS]KMP02327.1 hypothetical protein CIRG_10150 [Coccidioides immitis RMSCC 2394]TPX24621.1 hypothetical protein DIZ76_010052 [Coccidioides immitis]